MSLVIRPEDLTKSDPSRLAVNQTLGGAWADNFGPGISMINIAGHTGWRGAGDGSGDGQAQFLALRNLVYTQWHARRAAAVAAGQSADLVQLIFADALDSIACVVAPMNFTLKRSRSRPLLMMYQIPLVVISDGVGVTYAASSPGDAALRALGLDSLADSIQKITGYAADVRNFVNANLVQPVESFLKTANTVFTAIQYGIGTAVGIVSAQTNQLISLGSDIAVTGQNAFNTLSAVENIGVYATAQLSGCASAFSNIVCLLKNALAGGTVYQDYADLYGSSNCSSTSGGAPLSPLRNTNPFELMAPPAATPIVVTPMASSNLGQGRAMDPVLAPPTSTTVGSILANIGSGVTIT